MKDKVYATPTIELFRVLKQDVILSSIVDGNTDPIAEDGYTN